MPVSIPDVQGARMHKQWRKLERYGRQMLAQKPDDVYALDLFGEALEKQGRIDESLQCYERALEVDSRERHQVGHTVFFKRLDILYHKAGRYHDCLRVCQSYVDRHPETWDAWNRLRRAAKLTGDLPLSSHAKEQADEIKEAGKDLARFRESFRQLVAELYLAKLQERRLLTNGATAHESVRTPEVDAGMPDLDAPDEEWGRWVQETTDLDRVDARVRAFRDAYAEASAELEAFLDSQADVSKEFEREALLRYLRPDMSSLLMEIRL